MLGSSARGIPCLMADRREPHDQAALARSTRMAPGGVEPPHADSKSAALSTELRGRSGNSVAAVRAPIEGGGGDSNPRPPGPQPGALPTELPPPRSAAKRSAG